MGQYGLAKSSTVPGTYPEDIQRINAMAHFSNASDNPIVNGGRLTLRSDMGIDYTDGIGLSATPVGAAYVTWGSGTVRFPVPTTNVTKTVYVDRLGAVMATDGAAPAGSIILGKYALKGGATATNSGVKVYDPVYAVGRFDRLLYSWQDRPPSEAPMREERTLQCGTTITLPTDSKVSIELKQALTTITAKEQPKDVNELWPASVLWEVVVDGAVWGTLEVEVNRVYMVRQREASYDMPAGTHTIQIYRKKQWGNKIYHFASGNWELTGVNIVLRSAIR